MADPLGVIVHLEKRLGRIASAEFGYVGGDILFGLSLKLSGPFGAVDTYIGGYSTSIEVTERTRWTEKDRSKEFDKTMRKVNQILRDAKKLYVSELEGVPIEATFDGNLLKDWRVLTEVL